MRQLSTGRLLLLRVAIGLIAVLVLPHTVVAQTGSGVVTGVVQDVNEAVIPGLEVSLVNLDTNVSQATVTNEVGLYYFGGIPRGNYRISVQLEGFQTWTTNFELQVGQTASISPTLEIGEIGETLEVQGAAPLINTEAMGEADVRDFDRIQQLPLNGRSVANLFNLTPGVEGGGNARVLGQKVGSLQITTDGISSVDRFGGGMVRIPPALDAIQEFRIDTVGADARYSRPATVTLVTRSGTNELHGSLFEVHRNNAGGLRARRREESEGDAAKLIRNEFGANGGGPVRLGPLYDGQDRTFWFAAFEGLRQRQENLTVSSVPTDAMWNGDMSGLVDAQGNQITIYDPLTTDENGVRQPFPNNVIPRDRIHPFAQQLQGLTHPATNDINPLVGNNLETAYPVKNDENKLTLKVDHVLSPIDHLSVRWSRDTRENRTEGGRFGSPANAEAGLGTGRQDVEINNVSVNYRRTFAPTLLSEVLVGVNRSNNSSGTLADATPFANELGLPNPFGVTGWPTLSAEFPAWDADNRNDQALTRGTVEGNLTWIKGDHAIQFGGAFSREHNNVRELQQAQGSHSWNGDWTGLYDPIGDQRVSRTGHEFADMLLGTPSFLSNQFNRGFFYLRNSELAFYVQDKWTVTPRLTLHLGLRWEKWTPFTEGQNRLAAIDPDTALDSFQVVTATGHDMRSLPGVPPAALDSWEVRGLSWVTADQVGMPDSLFAADNNNFGPRVGAAFRLTDRTVLRGSYGEYFWPMPLSQILQTSRINPPLNLRFTTQPNLTDGSGTWTLRNQPNPDNFVGRADVATEGIVDITSNAAQALVWDARNWQDARSQAWNVTIEHEFIKETAVRLSYLGNHGSNLEQRASFNSQELEFNFIERTGEPVVGQRDVLRANPDWNPHYLNRTGRSNTHSAQVEVARRFTDGLAFQWFYTYSRQRTTTDADGFNPGNGTINNTAGNRAVPENHQILGNPSLSYDDRLDLIYFNGTNVPPHRIGYNALVDLPFGRGRRWAGDVAPWLNQLIGGWQVALIGDWRSGFWSSIDPSRRQFGSPDEILLDEDDRMIVDIFGREQRLWFRGDFDPNEAISAGGDLAALVNPDCTQRVVRQLGPSCDNQLPQELSDGTIRLTPVGDAFNTDPRAFFLGPGAWNLDFSLFKHFSLSNGMSLRFTADFFNVFNHPNDVAPDSVTGLQDLSQQDNEPRTIQLSLRLNW
ncbi:MAG: hypothetical protein GEU99_06315 [Luteitalea sp.]|nr:hypothetical protein [Luteitalea sp.]